MRPRRYTFDGVVVSCRTYHCLVNNEYRTWEEVASKHDWELLAMSNFGRKSLKEARLATSAKGLRCPTCPPLDIYGS